MTGTARVFRDRFSEEQIYIQRYVEFVNYKTAIHETHVNRLNTLLQKHGITTQIYRRDWTRWKEPYSLEELQRVYEMVSPFTEIIEKQLEVIGKYMSNKEVPENLGKIDAREPQGECIQYMLDSLEYDTSEENVNRAKKELLEQIAESNSENDHDEYSEEMIDYAVQAAIYLLGTRSFDDLQESLEIIREIDIAKRMSSPEAEINTLRQSFIVLMTIFDAAMFDIVRVALKHNFFALISAFGKQDKISLESLSKFGSFDNFRDEIIEEQLKSKYLKEILFILNDLHVPFVDVTVGDKFVHLIEMVLRRNAHIHNRGKIDEKYLERNDKGIPKYNIYNLGLGAIAEINQQYWERANRLCNNCINSVANWADTI